MNLSIPELSLVVLIGASGSGKSSLARRLFKPTEILSSDTCRGWVSDDENDQGATNDAFDVLHYIARKRLARGLLTVIDATNVRAEDRRGFIELAREQNVLPVAIVVDTPEHVCHERNAARPDRQFGPHVVRNQRAAIRRESRGLAREGFRQVYTLRTTEEAQNATLSRVPLWNNRKDLMGPFDIVGDVHGCYDELVELLTALGCVVAPRAGEPEGAADVATRPGRMIIFLGDLVDRGPKTPAVLRLVMSMVAQGKALCVPGNHDVKLVRALQGRDVQVKHGLAESLKQLKQEPPEFKSHVVGFINDLVSHYVLANGALVVAHAGMKEALQGRGSGKVREFALFGETTGETDEFGLPVRYNWAAEYRGKASVVYGHTPVPEPQWFNNTVCLDTGCVFGGSLTALRWPEREFVSVKARAEYATPRKPFLPDGAGVAGLTLQQQHDDLLDLDDVVGKRPIETRLSHNVMIRTGNAAAALEVMSRFAADPRWLIYLPPTMSPCETSAEPGYLEHPREAFDYFRANGVGEVICEEKHMGSRAVVVVCRDEDAARRRFGASGRGIVYTRTGRHFFDDASFEAGVLDRVAGALGASGLWDELATDWVCLDCELMPWSAKAQGLIRDQFAAVGAASMAALSDATGVLELATSRMPGLAALRDRYAERRSLVSKYIDAYRRYCWPVAGVDDLRLVPFHLLASEGHVHVDKPNTWHMETLARLAATGDPMLVATKCRRVNLASAESEAEATAWWLDMTGRGGEGMVVKPVEFIAHGPKGIVQPGVKCRGPEYLRIIYGPEYSLPENLARLRRRSVGAKRSLAHREFALGVEGLERFVRQEPLRRVHECVFGVLALESEPVDPRL